MSRWAAALLIACAVSVHADAGTRVLYSFKGGSDGATPLGRLLLVGKDLYGTTSKGGGTGCERGEGCGIVFKIAPDGAETVLHVFQGGTDGAEPAAGLIADSQGNLYGTTTKGGGGDCTKQEKGCGTVFKVATDGTTTILHAFPGHGFGKFPSGPLVADKDGNLYGTTLQGGHGCNNDGCGIVYKLAPDGTFTRFFLFPGPPLIYDPSGGLLLDEQGNLYGVTQNGGNDSVGMIYELAPDGTATYLHDFDYHQGGHPFGELVADAEGNLYGTTLALGSVYKLAPDGTFTALHEFTGDGDGDAPWAGVILDSAGNLYGTASTGGLDCSCGTVFELAPDGAETTLYSFKAAKGSAPKASLIMDRRGNLYGTASEGGANGFGSVFRTGN
jgi:uncharacterized repeat protein (TIGR03803 family)